MTAIGADPKATAVPDNSDHASKMHEPADAFGDLVDVGGMRSEHILLEGDEVSEVVEEPSREIEQRFGLRNRVRARQTILVAYSDGFLGIRMKRRKSLSPEYAVALRFLDPEPLRAQRKAKAALTIALTLSSLVALAGYLAYRAIWPAITLPTAAACLLAAPMAWWVFLLRTWERVEFRTCHGEAVVLTLTANPGAIRRCRALAARLRRIIEAAHERNTQSKHSTLRAEVREHYRLNQAGVLSTQECTAAIQRTLRHFD